MTRDFAVALGIERFCVTFPERDELLDAQLVVATDASGHENRAGIETVTRATDAGRPLRQQLTLSAGDPAP